MSPEDSSSGKIDLQSLIVGTDLLSAGITPEMCNTESERIKGKYDNKNNETPEDYARHNILLSIAAFLQNDKLRRKLKKIYVGEDGLIHVLHGESEYIG